MACWALTPNTPFPSREGLQEDWKRVAFFDHFLNVCRAPALPGQIPGWVLGWVPLCGSPEPRGPQLTAMDDRCDGWAGWRGRGLVSEDCVKEGRGISPRSHPSFPTFLTLHCPRYSWKTSPSRRNALEPKLLLLPKQCRLPSILGAPQFLCSHPLSCPISASPGPRQPGAYFCQDSVPPLAGNSFL